MSDFKIYAYDVRPDEEAAFHALSRRLGISIILSPEAPSLENAALAQGCDGITMLGQGNINAALLTCYHSMGIRYLSTRTIGYNHIDLDCAHSLGIRVCNASYAPNGVADFTVMMILMCLRNYKQAMWRSKVNDFSLSGLMGREMRNLTIGIMGTGRIGRAVIQNLSGFGCRLLAYDVVQNEAVKNMASYVDLDTLYRESDVITLHMPLLDSTKHIINQESIAKMKDQIILINCARGQLMDSDALVDGIEKEKIGALGIDTFEGEENVVHKDLRVDIIANRNLFYLQQFRNVIFSQHMAFYTKEAIESMVSCGVEGLYQMFRNMKCPTELL